MPKVRSTVETIARLRLLFAQEKFQESRLVEIDPDRGDFLINDLEQNLALTRGSIARVLDEFTQFPPLYGRHAEKLTEFHKTGNFEKSVFIMTKFPDGKDPHADGELSRVIDATREAIRNCSFVPRVADRKNRFHPGLWDNVELHLLGCKRGVAILEDRYRRELNPNVAMEWGWMRALGRDVLYLRESSFSQDRADISGLITDPFVWEQPEGGICQAISTWLGQADR